MRRCSRRARRILGEKCRCSHRDSRFARPLRFADCPGCFCLSGHRAAPKGCRILMRQCRQRGGREARRCGSGRCRAQRCTHDGKNSQCCFATRCESPSALRCGQSTPRSSKRFRAPFRHHLGRSLLSRTIGCWASSSPHLSQAPMAISSSGWWFSRERVAAGSAARSFATSSAAPTVLSLVWSTQRTRSPLPSGTPSATRSRSVEPGVSGSPAIHEEHHRRPEDSCLRNASAPVERYGEMPTAIPGLRLMAQRLPVQILLRNSTDRPPRRGTTDPHDRRRRRGQPVPQGTERPLSAGRVSESRPHGLFVDGGNER